MIRPKPHLSTIYRSPAEPETRLHSLRMDKNEFVPCWPDEWFQEFLQQLKPEHIAIHPELYGLYGKLESLLGFPREQFVVTAGSDLAIKATFEVFVEPGDEVITPSPTFAMYVIYAELFRARHIQIDFDEHLHLDVEQLIGAIGPQTKLVAIANPNSPTGTIIEKDQLLRVVSRASQHGAVVLVDEAYYPFYESTMLDQIDAFDNLIVTRTMSKAAGMGGMRTGFLASNKEIARLIFAMKPMYEITTISCLLAEYALDHYDRSLEYARQVREGRRELAAYFTAKGFGVFEGDANFMHVDFGADKARIVQHLKNRKVLFKDYFQHRSLQRYSRFTVGPPDFNAELMKILDELH
jgi:histidinol-phosphate aminotransferase